MIKLLSHDGSDNSIANTARVSFAGTDWLNLPKGYSTEQRDRLITYLAKHKHLTPFRHNSLTIRCKMPIFIARQLGKHQAGLSWNEVSRRYVIGDFEFFSGEWRYKPAGSIKQGSAGAHPYQSHIQYMHDENVKFALRTYNKMIKAGVAPEQARGELPQSMFTEWVWTGNILAFAHVYKERIASGAQVEAQEFAKELDKVIRPQFPVAWSALVGER